MIAPNRTPGTWYAHDVTTEDSRPVWHSEVRAAAGPSAYITIALCRNLEYQQQDAEYIARVANAHDALVEALRKFVRVDGHTDYCPGSRALPCLPSCALARAALALARGDAS